MSESLHLRLEGFEGPLDLLLELARSQKVDIARISIVALVDQYLAVIEGARRVRLELAADWRATSSLKFQLAWSWLDTSLKPKTGNESGDVERNSPQYQAALRTAWNPRSDIDVDLWLRRVGRINSSLYIQRDGTPAYTEADLRLAWRPEKTWELSLVGRNLLHGSHQEFVSELGMGMPMRIERSVFVQANKKF